MYIQNHLLHIDWTGIATKRCILSVTSHWSGWFRFYVKHLSDWREFNLIVNRQTRIFDLHFQRLVLIINRKAHQLILINKIKMKGTVTIYRPLKGRSKSAVCNNMFEDTDKIEEDIKPVRNQHQSYDFVGPAEFRKKLLLKSIQPKHGLKLEQNKQANAEQSNNFNQTATSKNIFNTTINRNTMLSSLHKEQQIQFTKQTRNIQTYKHYQQMWQKKKDVIKDQIHKKSPVLMETNISHMYVHPNQDKTDVINNFIVHYWEMSLRNNNPILERHIKGHRFQKVEKQKLLQLRQGIKKIQQSIPILPISKLSALRKRDLSVSGRNKIKKQADSESVGTSARYSIPNSARLAQQQVYKIDYEGDKKWMGTQNL